MARRALLEGEEDLLLSEPGLLHDRLSSCKKDAGYTILELPMTTKHRSDVNTGLRMGETRRLRWDWIDLERRWLTIDGTHAKTRHTGHALLND